jgi:hypothetical protein
MSRSSRMSDRRGSSSVRATKTRAEWPWAEIIGNGLTDPFIGLILLLICLVVSAVESLQ